MRTNLLLPCAAALITAGTASAQRGGTRPATTPTAKAVASADSLYRLGRVAVTDGDYRRAATLLGDVVDRYPATDKAGEALYWRAWSLNRLGVDRRSRSDLDAALEALDQLQQQYAKSASTTDWASLRAQIRSGQARLGDARAAVDVTTEARGLTQTTACSGSRADEETRMAALEGLMNMNADDALPILEHVLKQRDPCRAELRKKAVWLISQQRSDATAATLLDVARHDPSADVRGDAVYWLAQTRSELAVPMLDSILFTGADEDIRRRAIFSLSQFSDARARAAIQRAAGDERLSDDIRSDAIYWLGQSDLADLAFFKTLFRKTREVELRQKIVYSVSQSGRPEASAWLLDLARDKSFDTEVRKDAIFALSQRQKVDFAQLAALYDQSRGDSEIQDQVLFVFSQRNEPEAVDRLMAIAKSDPSIDRRKQALFWLGQKNDPRVKQFLRDLISK